MVGTWETHIYRSQLATRINCGTSYAILCVSRIICLELVRVKVILNNTTTKIQQLFFYTYLLSFCWFSFKFITNINFLFNINKWVKFFVFLEFLINNGKVYIL